MADSRTIHQLGASAFNMSYATFRQALDLEDDAYAIEKYQAFKRLGQAMGAFGDNTLLRLIDAYVASLSDVEV